jgi:hypothetical protein
MTPGFFDVVKPDGAGCAERTVKPSGFASAKKTKNDDADHPICNGRTALQVPQSLQGFCLLANPLIRQPHRSNHFFGCRP